jgi:hypothetical protein
MVWQKDCINWPETGTRTVARPALCMGAVPAMGPSLFPEQEPLARAWSLAAKASVPPIGCCKHRVQELFEADSLSSGIRCPLAWRIGGDDVPVLSPQSRFRCPPRPPTLCPIQRSSPNPHRSIPCAHHHAPALIPDASPPDPPRGAVPLFRTRPCLRCG